MGFDRRTRIAPTSSGFLHIGNAFNFLLTEHLAQRENASLRLRIDDLDAARIRPAYVTDIFENLRWLGISPDFGPQDAAEQAVHFSQTLRVKAYDVLLQNLADTGLVFACSCSRKDLEQASDNGQYTGACLHKKIPLDTPDVAWRIQTPRGGSVIRFHDGIAGNQSIPLWDTARHFIIRRRDGLPAYPVASLCDDVAYGINLIVRGADLLTSTGAQLYLASLMALTAFSGETRFYHHPLLQDAAGEKLSKSGGSNSLKALREAGLEAIELRRQAAVWWQSFL